MFNYVDYIGILAGCMIAVSFTPQVIQVVKTKSTKDISLGMFLIYITGVFLWIWYGWLINSWALLIANVIALSQASIILAFKLKYK